MPGSTYDASLLRWTFDASAAPTACSVLWIGYTGGQPPYSLSLVILEEDKDINGDGIVRSGAIVGTRNLVSHCWTDYYNWRVDVQAEASVLFLLKDSTGRQLVSANPIPILSNERGAAVDTWCIQGTHGSAAGSNGNDNDNDGDGDGAVDGDGEAIPISTVSVSPSDPDTGSGRYAWNDTNGVYTIVSTTHYANPTSSLHSNPSNTSTASIESESSNILCVVSFPCIRSVRASRQVTLIPDSVDHSVLSLFFPLFALPLHISSTDNKS